MIVDSERSNVVFLISKSLIMPIVRSLTHKQSVSLYVRIATTSVHLKYYYLKQLTVTDGRLYCTELKLTQNPQEK